MVDVEYIVIISLSGFVIGICLYWFFKHICKNESKNNNTKNRWNLIYYLKDNPDIMPSEQNI